MNEFIQTGDHNQSSENKHKGLDASSKFYENAYQALIHPDKSLMQAQLLGAGLVGGIVNQVKEDPRKAAVSVCESVVGGAAIGATLGVLAVEAPVIGLACAGGATALGAKWVWDKIDPGAAQNQQRNSTVKNAMDAVWNDNGKSFYEKHLPAVQQSLGKDGLEVCTGLIGGSVAGGAFRVAPKALASLQGSELVAGIKFATLDKTVWKPQPDGSKIFRGGRSGDIVKYPDGRTVSQFGIGKETQFRNGDRMTEYPNGSKEIRTKDGTEIHLANGDKRSQRYYSNLKIEKADGTVIESDLQSRTVTKPDGTRIQTDLLYGSRNVQYPDGRSHHTNYDGSTSISSPNTLMMKYPDGRTHSWAGNTRIYRDAQGNSFHLKDDGKTWTFDVKNF
jgi:hypothetical protein